MALTQVSTGGIKDGQVQTADLADGQVTAGKLHADALDRTYTLGADGNNHYTFTGEGLTGAVNDPTLYLTRGKTYRFVNGNSAGAHPFRIQTTVNGSAGTEYNTGVTNNGGAGGSTIIFEVPHAAPDVLYYQCTSHGSMGGILYITGALPDGGVTTAKIADNAVNSAKLASNSVTSTEIASDAVTSNKIISGAITNTHIGTGAINADRLTDATVTLAKLEHGTSSNDGKFLRANNGADPTFESLPSSGVTVSNNADNRVVTGDGTNLVAESALVFDGTKLGLGTHTGVPNTKVDIGLGVHAADGDDDASDWGANNVFQLTATGGNAANNQVLLVGCHSGGVGQIGSAIGFGRESTTNWGTYLSFKTHPTATSNIDQLREVMRIESDGRTKIHTLNSYSNRLTDPSGGADDLVISGDNDTGITIYCNNTSSKGNIFFADAADNDVAQIQYQHNNNQFRMYVNANGTPVMQWNADLTIYFNGNMYSNGNSYSTGSDLRLKSNLVRFTDTLTKLKEITGYQFDIKCGENRDSTRKSAGVIAQDVEKVYPDLVEEVNGYKHLEYSAFTGILVEAVKELAKRLESVEGRLAIFEAET